MSLSVLVTGATGSKKIISNLCTHLHHSYFSVGSSPTWGKTHIHRSVFNQPCSNRERKSSLSLAVITPCLLHSDRGKHNSRDYRFRKGERCKKRFKEKKERKEKDLSPRPSLHVRDHANNIIVSSTHYYEPVQYYQTSPSIVNYKKRTDPA